MDALKVFDTWVEVPGKTLHFDVMTGDQTTALRLANAHLEARGYAAITVTAEECRFCHQEPLALFTEQQQREYRELGGFIVPLSS
ncbi:MAG: hypothetical protein A2V62_05465 [Nitrospirae bacterium RBG_19FT_COMBO_58_9]|nr:MAG: hypothetical protein A2V62_05465 [Nitrospirae bacterium RBG_19FT_COMBO_58_9]